MAEPPPKRFRFEPGNSRSNSGAATSSSSSSSSNSNNHNNNNNFSTANKNANDDPWGDDIVFDEQFERQFQEICSQNISTVVDFNRRSSHPSQHPQQPTLAHPHAPTQQRPQLQPQRLHPQTSVTAPSGMPGSPTIRRSISNQSTVSFSASGAASAAAPAAVASGVSASSNAGPTQRPSGLSSQYYSFQRQKQPAAPVAMPASVAASAHPSVARFPAAAASSISSTQRKPSGSDALADIRDRLFITEGVRAALQEKLDAANRALAAEQAAKAAAEAAVRKLETERAFSVKEIETLQSENQSLSIRLRKREEQQQQTQLQFTQLLNRDVIPPTQLMGQQVQQQQQFPNMASFCSRSPIAGPSSLGMRSPQTPLRAQQPVARQPLPPAPPLPTSGSPSPSVASTDDLDYDDDDEAAIASAASVSVTPGGGSGWPSDQLDSDESDSWPAVAKQPESASWHRRRAELLAMYPGLLAQCSNAERALRYLNGPQQSQHQRQLPADILDDLPAAAWSPEARREVADALDCLAKLTTRELEPTTMTRSAYGPVEAERLLAPIRCRLSGYLLALRLRGFDAAVCARQIALALSTSSNDSIASDSALCDSSTTSSYQRSLTPTPVQLSNLGLDALQQLWRLCQLSSEATLGVLRNIGRRETALLVDLFDLVRLLPSDSELSVCDQESLHCCLQLLHYLLLRLPENRRHQLVEFFCTGLEPDARRRLVRSRYRPSVTLYVKILAVVHSGVEGYCCLAAHNEPCRIVELAQCLELQSDAKPNSDLLQMIDALTCLIRECIALERMHKPSTGLTLLNRDCHNKCFFKVICALSNALAQLMPLYYCATVCVNSGLVSSIHGYMRTMDALKDYLDVQSCKELVRQDKTHYFIISVVECFKDLTIDKKYQEEEYVAPCRPSLDA